MAETKKSSKQRFMERLGTSNPGKNFDDEETFYGQLNDDYDKHQTELDEANKNNREINEMLSQDPRSASFLTAWRKGGNPIMAFIEEYGEEVSADIANPANKAKVEEASKKYLEKLAKSKALDEEYEKNIEQSREMYQQMVQEGTYTQEQIDAALDKLEEMTGSFLVGMVSRETLEAVIKSNDYDTDVAAAGAEGEVRGRNAQIAAKRKMAQRGDGLPRGGSAPKANEQPEDTEKLGALARYGKNRYSIWDD